MDFGPFKKGPTDMLYDELDAYASKPRKTGEK